MTSVADMDIWIEKHHPRNVKVYRLDSQEMLLEVDFAKDREIDSEDGWWRIVQDAGFVMQGMSYLGNHTFRIHFLRDIRRWKR